MVIFFLNHDLGSSIESELARIPPLIPDPTMCRIPPLIPIEYSDPNQTKNGFQPSIKLETDSEERSEEPPKTAEIDHPIPPTNNITNKGSLEDDARRKDIPVNLIRELKKIEDDARRENIPLQLLREFEKEKNKEKNDKEVCNGWFHQDTSDVANDSSVRNKAFSNARKNDRFAQIDNTASSNETRTWEKVLIILSV